MNLTQLLKEAQFHGSNRLATRRHRYWWALALFLALWASSGVILGTVWRYFENPTFMTLLPNEDKQPFPAVHICPEISFSDHRIAEFLSEICRWLGVMKNCSEIFTMELTPVGFCCVFNGRSLRRELDEHGIHKVKHSAKYLMSHGVYATIGLVIALNQSQKQGDVDLTYKWLGLESGQDYVEIANNGTPLPPGYEMWTEFGLQRFRINDDARSLSADLRRCRLSVEPLKYFPIYKKNYCLFECEIERTLRRCHCLRAFHPRIPGAVYCSAKSLLCAKHAAVPYGTDQCECPPTCDTDMVFFRSQSFKLIHTSAVLDHFYSGLDFKKVTVVRVDFHSRRTRVFSRRSYYNYLNLYSQLGGAFNLFFGCSVLTILELLQLLWHGSKKLFIKARVKGLKPTAANKRPFKKNKRDKQKQKKEKKIKFVN